jgi:hypothetical protein
MKLGKTYAVVIAGAAVMGCVTSPVRAQRVFACSLGNRSVSVTAIGDQLTYKFGTPTHTELSIVGSAGQGNILYRIKRYASMEYQLRFVSDRYSYIVYSMGANRTTGSASVSGLTVMEGTKVIKDLPCKHFTVFGANFALGSLPEDTEEYSAM